MPREILYHEDCPSIKKSQIEARREREKEVSKALKEWVKGFHSGSSQESREKKQRELEAIYDQKRRQLEGRPHKPGVPMMRLYKRSRKSVRSMVPVGWLCPACKHVELDTDSSKEVAPKYH